MGDPSASKSTKEIFDHGAADYEASTGGCTRDLARHMLALVPPITSNSIIHDNACGTGIVAQEIVASSILAAHPGPDFSLTIHCTDKSENMIRMAQEGFKGCQSANDMQAAFPRVNIEFGAMPSEKLDFTDEYFTHSFTNCGILWFDDGIAGAKEILRTLKPGGIAVMSSWKEMPIFDVVREAQRACGQSEPLFKPPVNEKWHDAGYLKSVLKEAGFGAVETVERIVHFAGSDVSDMCGHLMGLLRQLRMEWSGEEEAKFRKQLEIAADKATVSLKRPDVEGKVEDLVGIAMVGLVAVARKEH